MNATIRNERIRSTQYTGVLYRMLLQGHDYSRSPLMNGSFIDCEKLKRILDC